MKNLKELIEKKYNYSYNLEEYGSDLTIILEWINENYNQDLIDKIEELKRIKIVEKNYQLEKLKEHQAWNAISFGEIVYNIIRKDIKDYGSIKQENFPPLTNLLRMYIDSNVSFFKLPQDIQEIITQIPFGDNDIEKWKKNEI